MAIHHRINQAALYALLHSPTGGVARDMLRRGLKVEAAAKRNLAGASGKPRRIDTGLLRSSISTRMIVSKGVPAARIGTSVRYACILGARTRIVTSDGFKTIGQIVPGDLVLTQTGEFRAVLACSRFPVTEKPDLVEIEVPWRTGGPPHRITVTADHKVLIDRDGVKKWIEAGDLLLTDELHVRSKLAHNRGAGRSRTCDACGRVFSKLDSQGKRFCSWDCRNDYWRQHGHWMLGRKRGAEFSSRLSRTKKEIFARRPDLHPNRCQPRVTDTEKTLAMWFVMRGVKFEHRKNMGGLWPDFYVAAEHRIYEADGAYWHQDQTIDIERDRRLLETLPDVQIVHVHFRDPRFTPDMVPNPLPGVHYVVVNPGTKSFVEPTVFEGRRPTSVRRYRYERSTTPHASAIPMLYDLAVEGVHSFLANGILVSNSWVHFGTGLYGPRHRPITAKRGGYLVFTPKGARGKIFVRSVKGMKPNPFLSDALSAAKG